jgi:MerR family transcriptional regulator, light-induced transcriptional regulator
MTADFATRLKELRVARGVRQKDLAAALGLAQTTIANYEQKLRFPDEPTLVKIADYFTVSLDHLMGRDNGAARPVAEDAVRGDSVDAGAEGKLSDLAREYLTVLLANGRKPAWELIREAHAGGTGIRALYIGVFAPSLREVGRRWARGELSVGEEHLFSESTQQVMARLRALEGLAVLAPEAWRCVVLAVGGETHLIGARMVADFLEMAGWEVRFPGDNLSLHHARELLLDRPPNLLAISVTLPRHLNAADDLIRMARAQKGLVEMKILVGGQAFADQPDAWKDMRADALAQNAEDAVHAAVRLMENSSQGRATTTPRHMPTPRHIPADS